ncbi:MAG: energy transducer TonB [Bacteroidales bacterium]|nr:energy transducer TonB [Bacteroidales bacterium]
MKIKLLLSTFLFISVIVNSQPATAILNYEKGTEALESKNYKDAISFLTLSIDEFQSTNAFYNRALAKYYIGDSCGFCSDLKKGTIADDFEAQKLYLEKCTYCVTIKNLSDSTKSKNLNIRYVQIFHSKCTSDSTISYIYEKSDNQLYSADRTETDTSPVFTIVEEMPSYSGGENARNRFLAENINYPEIAQNYFIQGTCYVQFIIDINGSVSDVLIVRGIGGGCDEEAIRVVKMMPKWKPGKQNGKNVRVLFNMPIEFRIEGIR